MASRVQTVEERASQEEWRRRANVVCVALKASPYPDSLTISKDWACVLVRQGADKHLLLLSESEPLIRDFRGKPCNVLSPDEPARVILCPLTPDNADALRRHAPFLAPVVPSRGLSIGTGDRLGVATPGHIRAIQGRGMQPVLAQQSIREMSRTERAPREVLDDAMWGVLQTGYWDGYAADADHLKTPADIALTLDAGFTMFTIDPGDFVDDSTGNAEVDDLAERIARLPWDALKCTPDELRRLYADQNVTLAGRQGTLRLHLTPEDALRAAVKYGRAIAHTVALYRYLVGRCARERFAFEVAVDETETPTSAIEHFYVASELKRLGVQWESLAPRFVGSFCKGIEYIGDLTQFRTEFGEHVLIAEHFGGYKLSLHSGSDKFKLYPIIAELAGDLTHIKTAGTSYLEALRVVANAAPDLFRDILAFAKRRYLADKTSYHVSADPTTIARPDALPDRDLPGILDEPGARQVCHVTFGSVLTTKGENGRPLFRDELISVLRRNEEAYYLRLEEHFGRHISPFV